jgi:hydroxymethylglutaryl-CoA lyase
MMQPGIEVVEVGPRDGFQSVVPFIPTEVKIDIIGQLAAAGFRRIEVGSFVSRRAVPQMSDVETVTEAVRKMPALRASFLVPNEKGAERAAGAGAAEIVFVCSASDTHNQRNVRRSVQESLDELSRLIRNVAEPAGLKVRLDIATAFDCPFTGRTPDESVFRIIDCMLAASRSAEICLCDTTGRATPDHVERLFLACRHRFSDPCVTWAFHGHDTYGLGLANVLAAHRAGVMIFDASVAGLGGCPYAPGATGNVASEDLVYLFERMGIPTGIDLARLLSVADAAALLPGACVGGRVRGLPIRDDAPAST